MTINRIDENGKVTLKPDGWLDTVGSPELGVAVEGIESAKEIVLDFELVEYMSSAGLRQVVAAHKKAKMLESEFSVINVGAEVLSIFKMTGIDKKLVVKAK